MPDGNPLRVIYEHPTIAELALVLDGMQTETAQTADAVRILTEIDAYPSMRRKN